MITTSKGIRIFDDTGRGDDFFVSNFLYEDKNVIVCKVSIYGEDNTILIYKDDNQVVSSILRFYFAENYE
jgi:hypothetical protein